MDGAAWCWKDNLCSNPLLLLNGVMRRIVHLLLGIMICSCAVGFAQNSKLCYKGDKYLKAGNEKKAFKTYSKAYHNAEPDGCFKMAYCYVNNIDGHYDKGLAAEYYYAGLTSNPQMAIEGLKSLASASGNGTSLANMFLGYCYQQGEGVERDLEEAIRYYERAKGFTHLIYALQCELEANESGVAQNNPTTSDGTRSQVDSTKIDPSVRYAAEMPEFPGGIGSLNIWLASFINYPEYCRENNIKGLVLLEFVIEKDGSVGPVIIKKSAFPPLDNEAVRALRNMPKWKPGKDNGEPVRCYYMIPVRFAM